MKTVIQIFGGCGILLLISWAVSRNNRGEPIPKLKNIFAKDFLIGTAVSERQIENTDSVSVRLLTEQFSAVTPENIMKAELIEPKWNQFNFEPADKLVGFAEKNKLRLNAHNLIWHSQLPAFMKGMSSADSVRDYFAHHINALARHYEGKVYSWDVVNEALNEDGTLRKSIFLEKLGPEYIVEAFRLAQKAAPKTRLYYNDYNIEQPAKRSGAIKLIKQIQAAGVRIDGIGIQGHWSANKVPYKEIEETIKAFSALGIEVMFTELDLSVLPSPWENATADVSQVAKTNAPMNPYQTGLPDSIGRMQANSYAQLFRLFLKYKEQITRVTFWGLSDGQSWLNDWPIPGRTNYPLLFDRNLQPKRAFYQVVAVKS